jgi:hypothetical protein
LPHGPGPSTALRITRETDGCSAVAGMGFQRHRWNDVTLPGSRTVGVMKRANAGVSRHFRCRTALARLRGGRTPPRSTRASWPHSPRYILGGSPSERRGSDRRGVGRWYSARATGPGVPTTGCGHCTASQAETRTWRTPST